MKQKKAHKAPRAKSRYRIRNWPQYNTALIQRGSLTLWIDDESIQHWQPHAPTGQRGAPCLYSDTALLCALTLGAVYRLPLRMTQGLLVSVIALMGLGLPVPHYSTLCRRRKRLTVRLPVRRCEEPLHLVVDSTGLKVFGEGEWKARQHGLSKRRTWRKLHLGVNEATGEIVALVGSENNVKDGQALRALLEQVPSPLLQVTGDGGYDHRDCYAAIVERQARAVIPPRRNAKIERHGNCHAPRLARDDILRAIRKQGRKAWKQTSDYHRRSLAETAVFRLKQLLGAGLSARELVAQTVEMALRVRALNVMTHLGMPDTYVAT